MKTTRAFTLIEILAVCAIVAILASITLPSVTRTVKQNRIKGEDIALENLAQSITQSFENSDLNNINIASLGGTVPVGVSLTVFNTDVNGLPAVTTGNEWYIRLARLRGNLVNNVVPTTVDRDTAPEIAKIALNASDQPRLLIPGPTNEANVQRFLLISLMAPAGQLQLPPYDFTSAWFDEIWNYVFDSNGASTPSAWTSRLPPDKLAAWNTGSGGTNLWLLRVKKITLRKCTITVNNTHAADTAVLYYNINQPDLSDATRVVVNPLAPPNPVGGILAGRAFVLRRLTISDGLEHESLRDIVRENATVTVQ